MAAGAQKLSQAMDAANTVFEFELDTPFTPATATTYWIVVRRTSAAFIGNFLWYNTSGGYANGDGRDSNGTNLGGDDGDLYFAVYQTPTPTNATWRPTSGTLSEPNPDDMIAYFLFDIVDAVTFGTDVIGKISIADGSPEDFVTGSWEPVGVFDTYELWRLDVDMTGKTGSTLEWSIETANNKRIRFKQSVGCVPLYL